LSGADGILKVNSALQLFNLSQWTCLQCVYELAQCGANLDATNSSGETVLHAMVRRGQIECVIGLLSKGASAAMKGAGSDNALHMAVEVFSPNLILHKSTVLKMGKVEMSRKLNFDQFYENCCYIAVIV